MTGGQSAASLRLIADFRSALLAEGTLLFLVFVLLAIGWVACREVLLARARAWLAAQRYRWPEEPSWRRVLRIGFGVLWIIDGLLQAQPAMPGGLASLVISPAGAGSPDWVERTVNIGVQAWSRHPVEAAAGAVWIQLGLGIWLVSVSSPRWSRLAGLTGAAWGLVVWVFGEAFGGMLASGSSWLTGAPGAALFYVAAGALLAVPARLWRDPRLGQVILQASGGLLAAFAVLQAWPGSGFWRGWSAGPAGSRQLGPLSSAIYSMTAARQPTALRDLIAWFAAVVASHGFAVNLVAVVVLAGAGVGLLTGWPAIARPAGGAAIGFCLAVWLLVQDLGVFGGLGTDPNSMLPQALILTAGLLAWTGSDRAAGPVSFAPVGPPAIPPARPLEYPAAATDDPRLQRRVVLLRPGRAARGLAVAFGAASASAVLTVWAVAMLLMGAAPMALAAFDHGAPRGAVAAAYRPMPGGSGQNADPHTSAASEESSSQSCATSRAAGRSPVMSLRRGFWRGALDADCS